HVSLNSSLACVGLASGRAGARPSRAAGVARVRYTPDAPALIPVGAPAPGANGCVPVRTEAVLLQKSRPTPLPRLWLPPPGAKGACRVRAEAVLLQKRRSTSLPR